MTHRKKKQKVGEMLYLVPQLRLYYFTVN